MTLKQGEDINKKFSILKDSLSIVKLNFEQYALGNSNRLQSMYDAYNSELNAHRTTKLQVDTLKAAYIANEKSYNSLEKGIRIERRDRAFFMTMLILFCMVVATNK